jgi:hypothetical protein
MGGTSAVNQNYVTTYVTSFGQWLKGTGGNANDIDFGGASGLVGIGTSAPAARLDVDALTSDASGYVLNVDNSAGVNLLSVRNDGVTYFKGNFGIGINKALNPLTVSPPQYSAGTASQSGTTVTGVSTTFTAAMVGSELVFANGTSAGVITTFNTDCNCNSNCDSASIYN